MKIAPLCAEMRRYPRVAQVLVHTGQHYDYEMSKAFFDDLEIPEADVNLEVGSGSHAEQTGRIMLAFEKVLLQTKPDLILVVGDVNSTIACALTAVKMGIKIAHVEAGLRSFDRSMPEEINRLLTDAISDFLFTTCRDAEVNLSREGIAPEKIFFVGNVMIDTLVKHQEKARKSDVLKRLNLSPSGYAFLTLHRPGNVDRRENFEKIIKSLEFIQEKTKIVYPVHPRTRKKIAEFLLAERFQTMRNIKMTDPLGYLDTMNLVMNAKFVMTDSGGLQEETTFLGIPCLTLRENTERPVTVEVGTNTVVGIEPEKIIATGLQIMAGGYKRGSIPELWDGKAAVRIVKIINDLFPGT